jgi:hypothetical protein
MGLVSDITQWKPIYDEVRAISWHRFPLTVTTRQTLVSSDSYYQLISIDGLNLIGFCKMSSMQWILSAWHDSAVIACRRWTELLTDCSCSVVDSPEAPVLNFRVLNCDKWVPYHHSMKRPRAVDGGTASSYGKGVTADIANRTRRIMALPSLRHWKMCIWRSPN